MRFLSFLSSIVIFTFITFPATAQHQVMNQDKVKGGREIPSGWAVRFDETSADSSDIKFTDKENKLHFTADASGAAIYYKPGMIASGSFSLQGTFIQHEKTHHPEAYGLFIGGDDLQQEDQHYLYFLIHQGGKFLIKRRTGSDTETIVDWTPSDAVHPMEASQQATNQLKITRDAQNVTFWINNQKVKSVPVSQLDNLEGIAGLRINHHLDITVDDFALDN